MKISVISAGKSITSGRVYHWNDDIIPDGIQPMQAMLNEQGGKHYSMVIAREPAGTYAVFMARLPLVSGARDDLGRPICAGFCIRGLRNEEARKLAIEYVKDKKHVAQVLCTPAVIKTTADFEVNSVAAEKAVSELLCEELPAFAPPVTVGELWGEIRAWERREELVRWLKNHRLSERPGNRVILCYFMDIERLSGKEDLVLHYSPNGSYSKELHEPAPENDLRQKNNNPVQVVVKNILNELPSMPEVKGGIETGKNFIKNCWKSVSNKFPELKNRSNK
ncbi:MAG: hypothetical protein MSQ05_08910 [Akkermansia sp.]|nr:hypothetical protein [Akkermansia sp.]